MTQEEFDEKRWSNADIVEYQGRLSCVLSVDFTERLIRIGQEFNLGTYWIRCENAILVP